uniref:SCP domain-containing protein n=1 Tax=Fundulus heteroclitus TaxID=8078 RepID=A0A3Q2PD46_FUNHE
MTRKEFLETHNAYRALHHAPPLEYNDELNEAAQKWADHCLKKMTLGHSNTDDGENVFYSQSTRIVKPTEQTKMYHFMSVFYRNVTMMHFRHCIPVVEHGVGLATDGRTVFVVGQYREAGNVTNPGYYEKNVLPKGNTLAAFEHFTFLPKTLFYSLNRKEESVLSSYLRMRLIKGSMLL